MWVFLCLGLGWYDVCLFQFSGHVPQSHSQASAPVASSKPNEPVPSNHATKTGGTPQRNAEGKA